MKAFILSVLVFIVACDHLIAQFSKGTVYVGGLGSYSYEKNRDLTDDSYQKLSSLLLSPTIGYRFARRLFIGGELGWLSSNEDSKSGSNTYEFKSKSYTYGPFFRYYSTPGLFLQGNYFLGKTIIDEKTFLIGNSGLNSSQQTSESEIKGYTVGLGYTIFFDENRKCGLDLLAGYRSYKTYNKFSGIVVGFGVSAFISGNNE